jgi:two-component system response regulator MtrA
MTMTYREPKSVLVVDDDPWICGMLSTLLGGEGYSVTEATDGKQGLQLAARNEPDVILLDLAMPGESGLDVLHSLKGSTSTRNIPVIVVSGHTKWVHGIEAGHADGVIQKPFDLMELLTTVEQATESRRSGQPLGAEPVSIGPVDRSYRRAA